MVNDMKIWINKCSAEEKSADFSEAITFNLSVPGQAGIIVSSIRDSWYRSLGVQKVTPVLEDLYVISLCVFAADKRIPRNRTPDGWTRGMHLNIPVLEEEKWNSVKKDLEKALSYLSGDIWELTFRHSLEANRYEDKHKRQPIRN